MYVKPIRYGQKPEQVQGQAVGSVVIDILPQGGLTHHLSIAIEEAHDMGKYPEPMLRVSVDQQKDVLVPLSIVLASAGYFDTPKPHTMDINITEPIETKFIKPSEMVKYEWYCIHENGYANWVIKFNKLENGVIYTTQSYSEMTSSYFEGYNEAWGEIGRKDTIRKATREEVLEYFPDEKF